MPSSIASTSHEIVASYNTPVATRIATDLKHTTFTSADQAYAQPMPASAFPPSATFTKSVQRTVRPKTGKLLFKSQSSPHLRGRQIMVDTELAKRNKLGYQRISIACAHCRRRKIRCLIAEDAADGRCANCIRLKKDCVFYPVDQQAAIDAQVDHSNRTNDPSGASSTVSNSPSQAQSRPSIPQDRSRGSSNPSSATDEQTIYRGVPIAPNQSQPPPGSFSAPIPQPGHFEHSNGYFSPVYGYSPQGDHNSHDNLASQHLRPIPAPVPAVAQSTYGISAPRADTAPMPYAFSSIEDASQYTCSPAVAYECAHHPTQHQQWSTPPQPTRSVSYSGSVYSCPEQQSSFIYPSFAHPTHAQPTNYPHLQHDSRSAQYPAHHVHPVPGFHPHMAPTSAPPGPIPLPSQPNYPQHYASVPHAQLLPSNWFDGPIDDATRRSHNVQTSRSG